MKNTPDVFNIENVEAYMREEEGRRKVTCSR
jgi:hypothetical protein